MRPSVACFIVRTFMSKNELTNMVMIQDKNTGRVLVQDRVKSWKGLSFPIEALTDT